MGASGKHLRDAVRRDVADGDDGHRALRDDHGERGRPSTRGRVGLRRRPEDGTDAEVVDGAVPDGRASSMLFASHR